MSVFQQLAERGRPPEWQGASSVHMLLSAGDEPEEVKPPVVRIYEGEKACSVCRKTLPATPEFFHRQSRDRCGLQSECKECAKQRRRERRQREREQ